MLEAERVQHVTVGAPARDHEHRHVAPQEPVGEQPLEDATVEAGVVGPSRAEH